MKKRILSFLVAVLIVSFTVNAASPLSDISTDVKKNVDYNGKTYQYVIQKKYETNNPDMEVPFDEEYKDAKLSDVSYETIETIDEELQEKTLSESKDYKDLLEKDESKIAKTITVDENVYSLKNVEWSEEPIIEDAKYTVDYGYQTTEPTPDATYEYTYTSPVTKEKNTVALPFVRMDSGEYEWVDGFSAIVTFHNLDGTYFDIGGTEVEYDANDISLGANEYKALIEMLGYDTSKYRFDSIEWSGDEYEEDGHTCRDAKVSGQQYATKYYAIYEDEVENGKLYTAHATYTCNAEVSVKKEEPTYLMKATGYYEKNPISPIVITIGIVVIILLVVAILYVLSRKKKKVSSSPIYTNVQK